MRRRRRRPTTESAPPRLVLRFAVSTGLALALAAAAILMVVRHYDTVQAERAATTQVRVLTSTVLRDALARADFEPRLSPQRRAVLDRLFQTHVLDEGFVRASLLAPTAQSHTAPTIGSPAPAAEAPPTSVRREAARSAAT